MRVLHLVHQYPPHHVGGVELYTHQVAQEQLRRGHAVAVFTRGEQLVPGVEHIAHDGVTVFAASAGKLSPAQRYAMTFGNAGLHQAFAAAIDEFRPDVVHVQHMMGQPASLHRIMQERRLRYVVTLHDYWWRCANANLLTNYSHAACMGPAALYANCTRCMVARSGRALSWAVAPLLAGSLTWRAHRLRQILDDASALIAPSSFVRDWYAAQGAPLSTLHILPLSVENAPAEMPIQPSAPPVRFFYWGGIAWTKGVHVALEAFQSVRGAAELWIGGRAADGAYSAQLQALATPNVRFLGRLERQALWETLAQVHIVLVPSLWPETFNYVAREALAAGRPIFTTGLGALGQLVAGGNRGLCLPPGDVEAWRAAMQRVVDAPSVLGDFAAAYVDNLTIDEHVTRLHTFYRAK